MAQAKKTPAKKKAETAKAPLRREIAAAVCFILAVFSFIGYFGSDGAFIGFFRGLGTGLVGPGFFAVSPALLLCAVILGFHRGRPVRFRVVCTLLVPVAIGAIWHLFANRLDYSLSFGLFPQLWRDGNDLVAGGAISGTLSEFFTFLFSRVGAAVVFICASLFLIMAAFNRTAAGLIDKIRNRERRDYVPEPEPEPSERPAPAPRRQTRISPAKRRRAIDIPLDDEPPPAPLPTPDPVVTTPEQDSSVEIEDLALNIPFMENRKASPFPSPPTAEPSPPAPPPEADTTQEADATPDPEPVPDPSFDPAKSYTFPPIDLLLAGMPGSQVDGSEEVRMNSERLESAFSSFGVNVKIIGATRGPSVTRFEAELEAGIKLNRLTNLADDIALSLGASGVRIAAMPDKISTVGIEVPNKLVGKVYLRDIIESSEFKRATSKLTFAIGLDITGDAVVGDIAKLPHLLVAGTTGSGKSVCLNSLILSILYKATPEEVRLIMIDPKMVEFKVYNSIPHLLVPVVTDVKKAAGALQWAVVDMMKRYSLFSETNARDLASYNQIARKSEELEPLPQIVVIIDELADLMMTAAKEVEESVCRVAQMGRAAGIHLVIATQSPRADVITGLMKANIPSRIALKVSSSLESRIILDSGGNAEKLVGNGDMLFAPVGTTKPLRLQGTWVSDAERENVVDFIKRSGESQYSQEVMGEIDKAAEEKPSKGAARDDSDAANDHDELLPQAADVIFETGQASVSMLQRRLKLGYSRAARIVDQLEQIGVVGPFEGSKPRALLITREQWRQMQYVNGTAPEDKPDFVSSVSDDEEL